uniref:Uncharacterized protein n=1 Tax=Oryza meridionalis TaxID=40149 RepID=A0A0E0EZ80_9ORYZ
MQSLAAYAVPFGSRGPTCSCLPACLRPNPSDLQKVAPHAHPDRCNPGPHVRGQGGWMDGLMGMPSP